MDIKEQVLLIAFILACLYAVITMQSVALNYVLKSRGWALIAAGFIAGGFRQVWGYIRLPAVIMKAQQQGVMPESLTGEQWFQVGMAILMLGLIILGLDMLRRDLRDLGI